MPSFAVCYSGTQSLWLLDGRQEGYNLCVCVSGREGPKAKSVSQKHMPLLIKVQMSLLVALLSRAVKSLSNEKGHRQPSLARGRGLLRLDFRDGGGQGSCSSLLRSLLPSANTCVVAGTYDCQENSVTCTKCPRRLNITNLWLWSEKLMG